MEATGLLAWLKVVTIMMLMIAIITVVMMAMFVIVCTARIPWRLLD